MKEVFSIGVDLGTGTMEMVVSKITFAEVTGTNCIQETYVSKKEIIYESPVVFTPMRRDNRMNQEAVARFLLHFLDESGIALAQLESGAVIITGESARKENAASVNAYLSNLLGDFVVAAAGPELEALLAAKGAGAVQLSETKGIRLVNIDIGGGTSNLAEFDHGEECQCFALDIGGRLIRFDEKGKIIYLSERLKPVMESLELRLECGMNRDTEWRHIMQVTDQLAQSLYEVCGFAKVSECTGKLYITAPGQCKGLDGFSISGGVGTNIAQMPDQIWKYGDIGVCLAQSIKKKFSDIWSKNIAVENPIRATVIGAGNHSMSVSGNTVWMHTDQLPVKNVPLIKLDFRRRNRSPEKWEQDICNDFILGVWRNEIEDGEVTGIGITDMDTPQYGYLKEMAALIANLGKDRAGWMLVVMEPNYAKALGQLISLYREGERKLLCLDQIDIARCDYIDIGKPIGNAVPVVIKTLIYGT